MRSGTDGALALSMMNVIIKEDLYDYQFVDNWTVGFDELRGYVAAFPPEEVEAITWVPQEVIVETARAIATARHATLCHYTGLLKMQPEPNVLINPQDAKARGIADGDRVYVESPRGRVPFRAKVTDWVVPGSVEVNVGGGGPLQPEPWREANANYLTDMDNRDPISGFPVLKALLCEVQKAPADE